MENRLFQVMGKGQKLSMVSVASDRNFDTESGGGGCIRVKYWFSIGKATLGRNVDAAVGQLGLLVKLALEELQLVESFNRFSVTSSVIQSIPIWKHSWVLNERENGKW
jgi:hypothetical protein